MREGPLRRPKGHRSSPGAPSPSKLLKPPKSTRQGRGAAVLRRGTVFSKLATLHKQVGLGPESHPGMIARGNIDLDRRPPVPYKKGFATVRTISIGVNGKEVLIPTVVKGKVVSDKQAVEHFRKTGQHLGVFDSIHSANHYAQRLHHRELAKVTQAKPEWYGAPKASQESVKYAARPGSPRGRPAPLDMTIYHPPKIHSNIEAKQVLARDIVRQERAALKTLGKKKGITQQDIEQVKEAATLPGAPKELKLAGVGISQYSEKQAQKERVKQGLKAGLTKPEIQAGMPIPTSGISDSAFEKFYVKPIRDVGSTLSGIGPGVVVHAINTYHHPVGAQIQLGKAIGSSFKETYTHPIRQLKKPGGTAEFAMNTIALPFAGARVASLGRAAELARAGELSAAARAAVRPLPIRRDIEYHGVHFHPPAYKSQLGGRMQQASDWLLKKAIDHPDNLVAKMMGGYNGDGLLKAERRVGRMVRQQARVKTEVRAGLATHIRSPAFGPSFPARFRNMMVKRGVLKTPDPIRVKGRFKSQKEVSTLRKSKRQTRMTATEQAAREQEAADTVASSRGYTMNEMHHDAYNMADDYHHELPIEDMVAVKKPPTEVKVSPNDWRTERQYAKRFENMFEDARKAVEDPDKYKWLPKAVVEGMSPYKPGTGTAENFATRVDKVTQGIRAGRFLHPGYFQWAVQNGIIDLTQQGAYIFRNVYALRHEFSKLAEMDEAAAGMMEQASGSGIAKATAGEIRSEMEAQPGLFKGVRVPGRKEPVKISKALETLRTKGERFWHHVDDRAFRLMALIHELKREGYHKAEDWQDLFQRYSKNDPEATRILYPIIQRGRQEIIDYSEMTPAERASLRRVFTAYGWTRGASTWTFRFPFQHPLQARVGGELGKQGRERVDEIFAKAGGMIPDWLTGDIPITGGKSPLLFETMFINPGETPGQFGQALTGVDTENLAGDLAPGPTVPLEFLTGRNRFGNPYKGSEHITGPINELYRRFQPIGALHQINKSEGTSTVKGGPATALERYLGIPVQRLRDIKATASLGMKSYEESLTRPQLIEFRHAHNLAKIPEDLQAFEKAGVRMTTSMIGSYKGDLEAQRERDMFEYHYAHAHHHKSFSSLPGEDKVNAQIEFLQRYRHLSDSEANQYKSMAQLIKTARFPSDKLRQQKYDDLASSLRAASGIGHVVAGWKSALKGSGG